MAVMFGSTRMSAFRIADFRLSISVAAATQPMCNEDGNVWITFNGEIYNFQELRKGLESQGHMFRTQSDTEVIIHAYEQYGRDCVGIFKWHVRLCNLG